MTGEAITFAMGPGEGATIRNPVGGDVIFNARASETGGTLTVFETVVSPGEGPPLHVHANEDEALYVLEGDVRFRLGSDLHEAPVGSFAFVPRGTPHCFQNVGHEAARMLVIFTPSGMEQSFAHLAAAAPGRVDQAMFAAAGRKVGMDVTGPPLARE